VIEHYLGPKMNDQFARARDWFSSRLLHPPR
jgi:hypothetical protein